MPVKKNKVKKNVKTFLAIYVFLVLVFLVNYTFSRYITATYGSGSIGIATPVLSLENNGLTFELEDMWPGEYREIEFAVSNIEKGQKNEVLLDYYFIIKIDSKIPLKFELYDENDKKLNIDTNGKTNEENMKMDYKNEITKNYKLKIIWDEEYNDYNYADESITINLELVGTQVTG